MPPRHLYTIYLCCRGDIRHHLSRQTNSEQTIQRKKFNDKDISVKINNFYLAYEDKHVRNVLQLLGACH